MNGSYDSMGSLLYCYCYKVIALIFDLHGVRPVECSLSEVSGDMLMMLVVVGWCGTVCESLSRTRSLAHCVDV